MDRVSVVDQARGDDWALYCGDSAEVLHGLPNQSVALSVFSPPFESLYTYSATERDLGNSQSPLEFWRHFTFISRQLLRLTMPGRIVAVHVADIPSLKERDGIIGIKDFSGATIRHFQRAGFIYHGRVTIDKDPQAQAIRTKSKGLLFVQMHKDSSWSRPALADYILMFRAPGENQRPIIPDLTNNEWIEWARPIWYGIRESDTLNVMPARSTEDERHIAPLQLGTIERCVRLWSNPGEVVLSPFAGIGSEGFESIRLGRRFIGVELKQQYFKVAVQNLRKADAVRSEGTLFSALQEQVPA